MVRGRQSQTGAMGGADWHLGKKQQHVVLTGA